MESRSVRLKYARSGDYLAGIGLNPDDDVMELVERYFPAGSSESPSGVSDNDDAAGDQHNNTFAAAAVTGQLLPLQDYVSGALDVLYYGSHQSRHTTTGTHCRRRYGPSGPLGTFIACGLPHGAWQPAIRAISQFDVPSDELKLRYHLHKSRS